MKRNDIILVAFILTIAVVALVLYNAGNKSEAVQVQVTVAGEVYGVYPLDEDRVVEINDTNVLQIQGGKAKMKEAVCPDKLCLGQHAIKKSGQTIVCLPEKVVVTILGDETDAVDAVAGR
ncbi:MAG: NusG domain II-containing protein [Lachnospiraceae bacterium]